MKQKNAKETYSRILTYFFFFVTFVGLLISLLSREIVELMASEAYKSAYQFVPLIVFAVVVGGVRYIFQTGLLLQKKTNYIPYITATTAIFNILILFFLIPSFGIYGAALAFLLSSFVWTALTYRYSQNLYPINYEYLRLLKIIVAAFIIYFLSTLTNGMGLSERMIIKTGMVLSLPLFLFPLKFYRSDEIEKLFALRRKVSTKALSSLGLIKE